MSWWPSEKLQELCCCSRSTAPRPSPNAQAPRDLRLKGAGPAVPEGGGARGEGAERARLSLLLAAAGGRLETLSRPLEDEALAAQQPAKDASGHRSDPGACALGTLLQAVAKGRRERKLLAEKRTAARRLQDAVRTWQAHRLTNPRSVHAVVKHLRRAHAEWVAVFEKFAGGPHGGLDASAFSEALVTVHPRLSEDQARAVWDSFSCGTNSTSMSCKVFIKIVIAVAEGDREAAEFADMSTESFRALDRSSEQLTEENEQLHCEVVAKTWRVQVQEARVAELKRQRQELMAEREVLHSDMARLQEIPRDPGARIAELEKQNKNLAAKNEEIILLSEQLQEEVGALEAKQGLPQGAGSRLEFLEKQNQYLKSENIELLVDLRESERSNEQLRCDVVATTWCAKARGAKVVKLKMQQQELTAERKSLQSGTSQLQQTPRDMGSRIVAEPEKQSEHLATKGEEALTPAVGEVLQHERASDLMDIDTFLSSKAVTSPAGAAATDVILTA